KQGGDHDQRFAAVCGQHEQNELAQIVVYGPAFADCGGNRCEVVVGQCHVGGFACGVGAVQTHRNSDVGALERGRVVDPVACHGDDVAVALQSLNQAQL